jgi:hypothetical protein
MAFRLRGKRIQGISAGYLMAHMLFYNTVLCSLAILAATIGCDKRTIVL